MELLNDLLQVTLVGVLLGAGLPILFGIGIRLRVPTQATDTGADNGSQRIPVWQRGLAAVIFLLIIAAVVLGLLWITQGRLYDAFGWDIFGTGGSSGH